MWLASGFRLCRSAAFGATDRRRDADLRYQYLAAAAAGNHRGRGHGASMCRVRATARRRQSGGHLRCDRGQYRTRPCGSCLPSDDIHLRADRLDRGGLPADARHPARQAIRPALDRPALGSGDGSQMGDCGLAGGARHWRDRDAGTTAAVLVADLGGGRDRGDPVRAKPDLAVAARLAVLSGDPAASR